MNIKQTNEIEATIMHHYLVKRENMTCVWWGHYGNGNFITNTMWRIRNNEGEYILMYCHDFGICKLCPVSYQTILDYEKKYYHGRKLIFHIMKNGYKAKLSQKYIKLLRNKLDLKINTTSIIAFDVFKNIQPFAAAPNPAIFLPSFFNLEIKSLHLQD